MNIEVSHDQLYRLKQSMRKVWATIADDIAECEDDTISNKDACEYAIDADHLITHAQDRASNALVQALARTHGYQTLLGFLDTHIKLI